MYQWSPQHDLPYLDQFQAGGLSSVRGYSEGLLIGKNGFLFSEELQFPIAPQTIKIRHKKIDFLGKYVKGVFFTDFAGVSPYKSIASKDFLLGIGPGLRVALPGDAVARLYWGFPLLKIPTETDFNTARFHFEITVAPDFDKLLRLRKKREEAL